MSQRSIPHVDISPHLSLPAAAGSPNDMHQEKNAEIPQIDGPSPNASSEAPDAALNDSQTSLGPDSVRPDNNALPQAQHFMREMTTEKRQLNTFLFFISYLHWFHVPQGTIDPRQPDFARYFPEMHDVYERLITLCCEGDADQQRRQLARAGLFGVIREMGHNTSQDGTSIGLEHRLIIPGSPGSVNLLEMCRQGPSIHIQPMRSFCSDLLRAWDTDRLPAYDIGFWTHDSDGKPLTATFRRHVNDSLERILEQAPPIYHGVLAEINLALTPGTLSDSHVWTNNDKTSGCASQIVGYSTLSFLLAFVISDWNMVRLWVPTENAKTTYCTYG
ncbi:hypothetical protein PG991_014624 [Apiospora marii]|uniref:Uncharacterized protein n=1 Tax=Apiospora marii TaxID=335849 RepID=A0ABR1R457_9PEZI